MVDVQWPHTNYRHGVETLQIVNPGDDPYISPMHEDVPGGPGSAAQVSEGGPQSNVIEGEVPRVELVHEVEDIGQKLAHDTGKMINRVAQAFVKKSLYWHARDRKYRVSAEERKSGNFRCPMKTCDGNLRRATYKMEGGCCEKLHACPKCMFMIKSSDLMQDHHGEEGI
jgi:hypothetical protein